MEVKKIAQDAAILGTSALLVSSGCIGEAEKKNQSASNATQTATSGPTMTEILTTTTLEASENGTKTPEFFIGKSGFLVTDRNLTLNDTHHLEWVMADKRSNITDPVTGKEYREFESGRGRIFIDKDSHDFYRAETTLDVYFIPGIPVFTCADQICAPKDRTDAHNMTIELFGERVQIQELIQPDAVGDGTDWSMKVTADDAVYSINQKAMGGYKNMHEYHQFNNSGCVWSHVETKWEPASDGKAMLTQISFATDDDGCATLLFGIRHPPKMENEVKLDSDMTTLHATVTSLSVFRNLAVGLIQDGSVSRSDMQKPGKLKA